MFSGESESQARRRTLSVLLDESRKVLEASRELSSVFEAVVKNDPKSIESSINKIGEAEDEVEGYRRALTRELAEVGSLLMNREDLLKTAYEIEEIAGYGGEGDRQLSRIEFRDGNRVFKKYHIEGTEHPLNNARKSEIRQEAERRNLFQ